MVCLFFHFSLKFSTLYLSLSDGFSMTKLMRQLPCVMLPHTWTRVHLLLLQPNGLLISKWLALGTQVSHFDPVTNRLQKHWPVTEWQVSFKAPERWQLQGWHLKIHKPLKKIMLWLAWKKLHLLITLWNKIVCFSWYIEKDSSAKQTERCLYQKCYSQ